MNERLAFLRAIRANPDDDTTRLVFADWLNEHDEHEFAEFIRVQIELEPIRFRIDNPRAVELHAREDELLRIHRDDWVGDVANFPEPADFGPVFRRGLPDYACLSLDTFLSHGEALFAAFPTLRKVALYGVANRCDELTLCPLLANLDTLEIADWPTRDDAAALAVSPHLDRVWRFKLWVGGESWLLHELVQQMTAAWPWDIELVQVYGGAACLSTEFARELDDEADTIAREANAQLGRPVVHVTRPFDQLFPLNGDVGHNLRAGYLPDGSPALAAGSFEQWIMVTFRDDGHVQDVVVRNSAVRLGADGSRDVFALDAAFREWVDEQCELEAGLIWVREFMVEDLSVVRWTTRLADRVANYNPHAPENGADEYAWRDRGGDARGWLERQEFVLGWGNDFWADWRGKIHSS